MRYWGILCVGLVFAMSCDCGTDKPKEQVLTETLAEATNPEPPPQRESTTNETSPPETRSTEQTPAEQSREGASDAAQEPAQDTAPTDKGTVNDAKAETMPEAAAEQPAREARSCSAKNPQGCSNVPCPKGQVCWRGYDMKKECIPLSCQCNQETKLWRCDDNCDGGKCVSPCVANPPTVDCCQGGKPIKPACSAGVFSCPQGAVTKQVPGCGNYTGAPEAGVRCEGKTCVKGERCCYSGAVICSKATSSCFATNDCDGPEDCGSGSVCCSRPAIDNILDTWCTDQKTCLSQPKRWVVCGKKSDCPTGYNCCKTTLNKSSDFGVCLNQPC